MRLFFIVFVISLACTLSFAQEKIEHECFAKKAGSEISKVVITFVPGRQLQMT